jgi:protochlorophyllide reductase
MENKVRAVAPSIVSSPFLKQDAAAYCTSTELNAISEKLYTPQGKESPKILGGVKIGTRKLVVVTGASSGLGLNCAAALVKNGSYFVVMAVRDVEKGKKGKP